MGLSQRGDGLTGIRPECVVSTSRRADLGSTKRTRYAVGQKGVIANVVFAYAPSGVRSAGKCPRESGGRA